MGKGLREPDLAQLLGWALSHRVSSSDKRMLHGGIDDEILEEVPLAWENYIHEWGCHESDFHKVTQYGSKMCHATVTVVTCDTTSCQL